MVLPSSGSISISQAAAEFGISLPCVFPDAFYGKPGMPASGALVLPDDFYGKANYVAPVWNYAAGTHNISTAGVAVANITCTKTVTWSYTTSGDVGHLTLSIGSGASATGLDMTLVTRPDFEIPDVYYTTFATVTLSATDGTTTRNWSFNLTAEA